MAAAKGHSNFEFDRKISNIRRASKILCLSCDNRQGYTNDGLKQHVKAVHKNINLPWQELLDRNAQGTKDTAIEETRELLAQLSVHNQVCIYLLST